MKNQKGRSVIRFIAPVTIMFSLITFTAVKAYTKEDELTIVFTNKITEEEKNTVSNKPKSIDYTKTVTEQPASKKTATPDYVQEDTYEASTNNAASIICTTDNLLEPSNITTEQLENIFSSFEYSQNMIPLASLFVEAEKVYGINAIILSSIASWESDYARSERATDNYNLFGWGVYTDDSVGINSTSYYESVMKTAESLKNDYLTPGGSCFNGYSLRDVNTRYCIGENNLPDYLWSVGISSISSTYLSALEN